jgi:hypothetical protein
LAKYEVSLRWTKTTVIADSPEEAAKKGLELLTGSPVNTVNVSHDVSSVESTDSLYIGAFKVWPDGKTDQVA